MDRIRQACLAAVLAGLVALQGCGGREAAADAPAALSSTPLVGLTASSAGYTKTRYPIVLVHGFLGFDQIGPFEYFYGIPSALRAGGADVHTPQVSATNSTEVRGEQLLLEVKKILAVTGQDKVHLIGHSHGAPTIRYVASVRPDLVASVTSVGGVNKGSVISDLLLALAPPGSLSLDVLALLAEGIGSLVSLLSGAPSLPQDARAAQASLSSAGAMKFNAAHPQGVPVSECGEGQYQVNGVHYFSWSGASNYTHPFDVLDPVLALTGLAFGFAKNDGLVSSCSSRLGMVIRDDYAMNHADEINQTMGIVNLFEVDPVTLYRQHANRLQRMGL